jgi:hypothetical protein
VSISLEIDLNDESWVVDVDVDVEESFRKFGVDHKPTVYLSRLPLQCFSG